MIYLFYGNDTKSKRVAYDKYKKIKDGSDFFVFTKNDFDRSQIENLYSGSGLFSKKSNIFFENVFDNKDMMEFIISHLEDLKNSGNDFFFLESKLLKGEIDAFKEIKAEISEFELPKEALEKYNNFTLANDFGARDKLLLWAHFREAIDLGVSLEELVGVLFWKGKDMILKKQFYKFKEEEIKNFVSKLSYILPESREKGLNDEVTLEKFLLESL